MWEEVQPGRREGVGWRRRNRRHAREGRTQGWGGRARAERTENMACMLVTLDVSKLSGWLNADANCRVERRACDVRPGRREGVGFAAMQSACTGRARLKTGGGQGRRGAHLEHVGHGRDAGRVEAERLVERRRVLPSRKAGMRRGKRCGPGGVRALGGRKRRARGWPDPRLQGPGHARSAPRT